MVLTVIQLPKNIFGGKALFEKRNIYESMKPFYYVARFYGFAPLQFGRNDPNITGIDFFLVTLNFICYLFIIYVQVAIESVYKHGVMCVDIGIQVLYFVTTCVSLATLIRILLNRHKIREIFDQLNKIDVEVRTSFIYFTYILRIRSYKFYFQFKSYGIAVSHGRHFIVLSSFVAVYLFITLFLFSNICDDYYRLVERPAAANFFMYMFVFVYNIGGYVAVLSYYFFTIMAITCRISLLNKCIR